MLVVGHDFSDGVVVGWSGEIARWMYARMMLAPIEK